jgi:hypothetical protein
MTSTFERHQHLPEISLETHVRRAQITLGEGLTDKVLVYLDSNYWINLQHAANDAEANPAHASLLDMLRKKVTSGVLLCPISASTFLELMKQADPRSRQSTGSLIDELSQGVALVNEQQRINTEISYFLHRKGTTESLHPLEHLVWCKLSYILGFVHPTKTAFDAATELAVQKAFFDHMWTIPLTGVIKRLDIAQLGDAVEFDVLARRLNQSNALHSGSLRSYKQTYCAEIRGLVDLCAPVAIDVVEAMARKRGIRVEYKDEKERLNAVIPYRNLLATALERDRARDILRTMHVQACLHASVRWNKSRKLNGNDLLDFHHASAALAYCHAFFTEGSLKTLISQTHLSLDKRYDCRVIASVGEAAEYVTNLA